MEAFRGVLGNLGVLSEYAIYCAVATFFASTIGILIFRKKFFESLATLRLALHFYFIISVLCLVLFETSYYFSTSQYGIPYILGFFIVCLTIQLQIQIEGESKLRNLRFNRLGAQFYAVRHWLVLVLGGVIFLGMTSIFGSLLPSIVTRFFPHQVIYSELSAWLSAPLALYFCQLIFEFLRTYLIRLEFRGTKLKSGELFQQIHFVAKKYNLPLKNVFQINLDGFGFNFILGHKSDLFISRSLQDHLTSEQFEFLVVQGLLGPQLKLSRQRILHYTIFSVGIWLPYILAVQAVIYVVPDIWVIPVYGLLYIALLVTQQILKRGIDALQFARRCQRSLELVGLTVDQVAEAYKKLNLLNTAGEGPRVLFGLPQAPRLFEANEKQIFRARQHKGGRFDLTRSARVLTYATVVMLAISIVVLKPRYEMREAAAEGQIQTLEKLLDSGANPNSRDFLSYGMTPLLAASASGHVEVVKLLLDRGAWVDRKHHRKLSPLLVASQAGYTEIVQLLVAHGAQINFKGVKGYTALMYAARFNHKDIVELLLEKGVALNSRSDHRSTALMLAVQGGNSDIVTLLLQAGADPRLRDADGDSALDIAKRNKFQKIAEELQRNRFSQRFPAKTH